MRRFLLYAVASLMAVAAMPVAASASLISSTQNFRASDRLTEPRLATTAFVLTRVAHDQRRFDSASVRQPVASYSISTAAMSHSAPSSREAARRHYDPG